MSVTNKNNGIDIFNNYNLCMLLKSNIKAVYLSVDTQSERRNL